MATDSSVSVNGDKSLKWTSSSINHFAWTEARVSDVHSVSSPRDDVNATTRARTWYRGGGGFSGSAIIKLKSRTVTHSAGSQDLSWPFLLDNGTHDHVQPSVGPWVEHRSWKGGVGSGWQFTETNAYGIGCGPNPCTLKNRDFRIDLSSTGGSGHVYFDNAGITMG